jgi:uncharacterized membrane protein YdjX (TVP38/TMEM64 family)
MGSRGARILATSGLAIGAAAGLWFHLESGIEWSVETFRQDLAALGATGPALFVAAVALRPFLLLPSWVFLVAGGILFGTTWGTLWSALGTVIGALWVYGVARGLARDAIERRLTGAIQRVDGYLGRHGAVWLAAYTVMPATPMTPAFAAAGLSSLRPLPFALAATAGAVPRCALYTFAAASFASGDEVRMLVASALLGGALLAGWLAQRLWFRAARSDAGGA